jgi:hypothetical protein
MTVLLKQAEPVAFEARTRLRTRLRGAAGTALLGGVLLLGCVVVQLLWLVPPYPSDQTNYLQAARDFPSQPPETFDHQYLRYGLVVPMRLAIEVFGYSQAAYYTVPVLSCALIALSTYALGVIWFGRVVGIAGALLTVGNSAVFHFLSMPSPDLAGTACFTAAVALAAALRQRRPWAAATMRRRAAALVLIGLLLAGSYLCREFLVALWPIVGLLLFGRTRLREAGWLVAPVIVLVTAETWINAVVIGDPLARFHAVAENGPVPAMFVGTFEDRSRWYYLTRLPSLLYHNPEGGWLLGLLALALVGGALAADALPGPLRSIALGRHSWGRRLGVLLLWIFLLWLPLTLLGGLLDPSRPRLRVFIDRYWFPVFPAIFLGGVAVAWLAGNAAVRCVPAMRHRAAGSVVASIAVVAVTVPPLVIAVGDSLANPRYRINGAHQLEDFRGWLAAQPDVRVIWTDRRTARVLPLFTTNAFGGTVWDGEIRVLARGGPVPGANERVALYSANSKPICVPCEREAKKVFGDPLTLPPTWTREYQTPDGVVQVYRT